IRDFHVTGVQTCALPIYSMAPTVVGWHRISVCPHCQGLLIVPASPPEQGLPFILERAELGICTSCRRTSVSEPSGSSVENPDRKIGRASCRERVWICESG